MSKILCLSVFLLAVGAGGMVHAEEPPVQRGLDLNRKLVDSVLFKSKYGDSFCVHGRLLLGHLQSDVQYVDLGIGSSLSHFKTLVGIKRMGPDVPPWVLPEEDSKIPAVEKLVYYANLLIEKYNAVGSLKEAERVFAEEWNVKKDELKRKYTKFCPGVRSEDYKDPQMPLKGSNSVILVSSILSHEDETPERDEFFLFVAIANFRPVVCGGYFPLVDEDCFCLLARTGEGGTLFRTFSLEKYLEDEKSPRTPWILWDKDGKIAERETRELMFQDYEPESFLSGNPVRREATDPPQAQGEKRAAQNNRTKKPTAYKPEA